MWSTRECSCNPNKKYGPADRAPYLQRKSIWHHLRWYKCPISGPLVLTPQNARSLSNQGVCGSVGVKQKHQMRDRVLAHSHHVIHEIYHRDQSLCAGVQYVFISAFHSFMYGMPKGVCASKNYERNYIRERHWRENEREGGRQTRAQMTRSEQPAILTDKKQAFARGYSLCRTQTGPVSCRFLLTFLRVVWLYLGHAGYSHS